MEIKTTEELRVLSEESLLDVWKCIADKKWVAVDNLIQRLIGASMLDICRIIKELKKGEEDKEEK